MPLSQATADEAKITPDLVRFSSDIELIVRLIEETPRDKFMAMMIGQLRKGLPYRNFLAGLYLANIRTGIVDHPLAVLHSTNQLTMDLPVQERLLRDVCEFEVAEGRVLDPPSPKIAISPMN